MAGETPASSATFAMVMFLAVVVSFDDLHDLVQAGQALAEWFHALDASARQPCRRAFVSPNAESVSKFSGMWGNLLSMPDDCACSRALVIAKEMSK
ncbi:hypothetical protein [Kineosporia mesophila]|uniref:hypothetical protein n=1 Tax=Kineosporia mesophila TaxID=566012 RepID=UPI001E51D9B6|nr:hypothetical protein [Kineosporia mesophila]MCD5351357.1 hypothetical protein [Kineosporia mesophila]